MSNMLEPKVTPFFDPSTNTDLLVMGAYGHSRLREFVLVLLRHRFARERRAVEAPQHGQRGKRLMIAAMSLRRMVAIEFGMCRSGRKGGSSGSVTVGYGKLREPRGGMRS